MLTRRARRRGRRSGRTPVLVAAGAAVLVAGLVGGTALTASAKPARLAPTAVAGAPAGAATATQPGAAGTTATEQVGSPAAVPRAAGACWQAFCANYPPAAIPAGGWHSAHVSYAANGRLRYATDPAGNRIPDFSYAGYRYGEADLPNVPVVATLTPVSGDNTRRIQDAVDRVGSRTPDKNGHRGALRLAPGTYEIRGTVRVRHSGVVLRGSGDGASPASATILRARGNTPDKRTVVVLGTNSGNPWTTGSAVDITTRFVGVGSTSFEVANAAAFKAGQEVVVRHPSSRRWLDAVGGGGVVKAPRWTEGSMDLRWVRRVTRIEGNRLHLDAPIYNHLDRSLTTSTVAPVTRRNLVSESGVENLRVDIETAGGEDEKHAWNAIGVVGADNSWVQNVSTLHFGYAGVLTSGAIRITVRNARATEPVAVRTGGNMYNFAANGFTQLVLFTGCHAGQGRHSFVSNGTTTVSGVVWHRCTMQGGDVEGHRRWSQGMLFDNIRETGTANSQAKLINRGDFGSSHGWGSAHSVVWGFNREIVVQQPPTAQNYAVSPEGKRRAKPFFPGPWGSIEIRTGPLLPGSLYEAQVVDRLGR
ncbi:MAG TPA: hypothetical protein VFR67_08660 [Pilimelia sp.]|nr:hypothetical protein [Pilimelia sp.]